MKTSTLQRINDFTQENIIEGLYKNPEFYHNVAMMVAKYVEKSERVLDQIREACYVEGEEKLKTHIGGLEFPNPVGLAAGFAKAPHGLKLWEAFGFGSITIGGVTLHAQRGNRKQRIFRPSQTDIVNGMGLPGKGLFETLFLLQERQHKGMYPQIPLGVNFCNSSITKPKDSIGELQQMMVALYPYVDYFEINISCPNQSGVCELSAELENILKELTKENNILANIFGKKNKFFVKISPLTIHPDNPLDNTQEGLKTLAEICNNYADDGVHGIIATNTAREHEYKDEIQIRNQHGEIISGGASGKQIQERSRNTVSKLRSVLDSQIPIIGVGGIGYNEEGQEGQSAVKMLDSGATSIQLYSSFVQSSVLSVKYAKEAILKVRS